MIKKLVMFLCAWLPLTCQAGILDSWINKPLAPPPMIDVLLVHDMPGVVLEVKGKYRLYDPKNYSFLSTRFIGKRKFIMPLTDGLKWGEEFPGLHQIMIVPDSQQVTTIVDGIEYRGSIYAYDVEGTIGVVNEVDIEDYLQSVLTPSIREQLPQEVLAAIAIATRTNAYYFSYNPKTPYWSIDGTHVGYKGYAVVNPNTPMGKAIVATRYLILNQGESDTPNPFPAQFGTEDVGGIKSKITLQQAVEMAKKGDNAAQILAKAFPGTSIALMHYEETNKKVMASK